MSDNIVVRPRNRGRRWLVALLLIVAVGGLAVAFTPDAIRSLAVRYLEDNGRRTASIGDLRLNPFSGVIVLEDVSVTGRGASGGHDVKIGRLFASIDIGVLRDRRVLVRRLRLENAGLDVIRKGEKFTVAGFETGTAESESADSGEKWLVGFEQAALRNVDLRIHDPDRSETVRIARADIASLLQWTPERPATMSVAASLAGGRAEVSGALRLFSKEIAYTGRIEISGIDLSRAARLAAPARPATATGRLHAGLAVDLTADDTRGLAVALKGKIEADSLEIVDSARLSGIVLNNLDASVKAVEKTVTVRLAVDATAKEAVLPTQGGRVALADFRWNGSGDVTIADGEGARYAISGSLQQGSAMVSADAGTRVELHGADISNVTAEGRIGEDGTSDADANVTIALERLSVVSPELTLSGGRTAWDGTVSTRFANDRSVVSAAGKFDSAAIAASMAEAGLEAAYRSLGWSGSVSVDLAAPDALKHRGDLTISGIRIDSLDPKVRVLAAESFTVSGMNVHGDGKWTANRIALGGIESLGAGLPDKPGPKATPTRSPVKLDGMTVSEIWFDGASRFTAASVEVDGFDIALVRDPEGRFRLAGSLLALLAKLDSGEPAQASSLPAVTFRLGEWRLSKNSRLTFIDRASEPTAQIVLDDLSLRMTGLDSAKPESPGNIELTSKIGKFGAFSARGSIRPFAERLNLQVDGKITGFELPAIRGYARSFLGYDVVRGRLDADVGVAIRDGKLAGNNRLTVARLKVEPGKTEKDKKAAAALPLETALSLLRDSKDVIRLDLPVSGDVADPKFDFSDAVNQALAGAMKKAVVATLSLTFPLGGVITAISDAGMPDRLGLKPVGFAPGSSALSPEASRFLRNIAQMMKARPEVKFNICGVATARDRASMLQELTPKAKAARAKALKSNPASTAPQAGNPSSVALPELRVEDEKLLALSKQRGEAIKAGLVKVHGIVENRLFLCAPNIAKEPDAVPRADITL